MLIVFQLYLAFLIGWFGEVFELFKNSPDMMKNQSCVGFFFQLTRRFLIARASAATIDGSF